MRRLSDGSDSCWSYSGSDSGNEAGLEVGTGSLQMGVAVEEPRRFHKEERCRDQLVNRLARGKGVTSQLIN